MTAVEQWDVDKTQYFNDRRKAPKQPMIQQQKKVPKPQPEPKPKEVTKPKETSQKQEAVAEQWDQVKLTPFQILMSCLGIFIFHSILQTAVVYMFVMGTVDAMGVITGTLVNAMVCGFRLCWQFKQ